MRKSIVVFVFCVVCTGLAIAGGKQEAAKQEQEVTIKVLFTSCSQTAKTKDLTYSDFTVKYPAIKVDWEDLSTPQMGPKIASGLAAGGYNWDVITWRYPSEYASAGFITPLDEFVGNSKREIEKEVLPLFKNYGVYNGKRYGIPWRSHLGSTVVYNEAMYKEAGIAYPPTSWDGLIADAGKFTKGDRFGFVFGASPGVLYGDQGYMAWVVNAGGGVFDEHWRVILNREEYVKGPAVYRELMKYSPKGVVSYGYGDVISAFSQGKIANMLMGNWSLGDTNNPEKSKLAGSAKIALLTVSDKPPRCSIGGWQMILPAAAEHKQAAWKYIEWATSPETEKQVMLMGGELNGCTQVALSDQAVQQQLPYLKDVITIAEKSAKPWQPPEIPEISQVLDLVAAWSIKAITGEMSDKEALDKAAQAIESLMKEGGYYK